MKSLSWKWVLGLTYIIAVAAIWIAASYVVQSVVDEGISPFLITYICNSLFVIYIPLVEIARYFEGYTRNLWFWRSKSSVSLKDLEHSEEVILIQKSDIDEQDNFKVTVDQEEPSQTNSAILSNEVDKVPSYGVEVDEDPSIELDSKGRWPRTKVAKVSLLICPFWFLAQLTFNLSLKYTTVTKSGVFHSIYADGTWIDCGQRYMKRNM